MMRKKSDEIAPLNQEITTALGSVETIDLEALKIKAATCYTQYNAIISTLEKVDALRTQLKAARDGTHHTLKLLAPYLPAMTFLGKEAPELYQKAQDHLRVFQERCKEIKALHLAMQQTAPPLLQNLNRLLAVVNSKEGLPSTYYTRLWEWKAPIDQYRERLSQVPAEDANSTPPAGSEGAASQPAEGEVHQDQVTDEVRDPSQPEALRRNEQNFPSLSTSGDLRVSSNSQTRF